MKGNDGGDLAALRGLVEALLRLRVRGVLEKEFTADPRLRALFDLTGRAPRSEMKRKTRLGTSTISRTWVSWHSRGLIKKFGKQYQKLGRERP